MSLAVVVFARLDSHRLPGKALKDIAGKTLLDRVIDRVRETPGTPPVIVATTARPGDDPVAELARRRDVPVFRGSVEDVAGRALACAEHHDLDRFVRISGDSPFIDPALIAACIDRSLVTDADLVTNVFPRSYPVGVSAEVIKTSAMRRIVEETSDPADREHVTRYAYRHPDRFSIDNVAASDDRFDGLSLAVDTAEDHARACWIFSAHGDDIDLDTAAKAARAWEARR